MVYSVEIDENRRSANADPGQLILIVPNAHGVKSISCPRRSTIAEHASTLDVSTLSPTLIPQERRKQLELIRELTK
jgi:hypothetical protein